MPQSLFERFLREALDHMHRDSVFLFSWYDAKNDKHEKINGSYQKKDKQFCFCHTEDAIDRIADEYGAIHERTSHYVLPRNKQVFSVIEFD